MTVCVQINFVILDKIAIHLYKRQSEGLRKIGVTDKRPYSILHSAMICVSKNSRR